MDNDLKKQCGNCKYWDGISAPESAFEGIYGMCRYQPAPFVIHMDISPPQGQGHAWHAGLYPFTVIQGNDWCSKFQPKK